MGDLLVLRPSIILFPQFMAPNSLYHLPHITRVFLLVASISNKEQFVACMHASSADLC
jgi:hypothetical protein